MTVEDLKRRADLNFEGDFGSSCAICSLNCEMVGIYFNEQMDNFHPYIFIYFYNYAFPGKCIDLKLIGLDSH